MSDLIAQVGQAGQVDVPDAFTKRIRIDTRQLQLCHLRTSSVAPLIPLMVPPMTCDRAF